MASSSSADALPAAKAAYDVVAIASSAGGLNALLAVLIGLPRDLPVAVLIVQHLNRTKPSHLAGIIARLTGHLAKEAEHGDQLLPANVYVAPPDFHMRVSSEGTVLLANSGLVNNVRPAADVLFESVAGVYGRRAIAVVLSGTGRDGAAGVCAVKRRGGTVIAQDASTAEFGGMPAAAAGTGQVDEILPLDEIGAALVRLIEARETA